MSNVAWVGIAEDSERLDLVSLVRLSVSTRATAKSRSGAAGDTASLPSPAITIDRLLTMPLTVTQTRCDHVFFATACSGSISFDGNQQQLVTSSSDSGFTK